MRGATRAALARYEALDLEYHTSRDVPGGMHAAWYALPLRVRVRILLAPRWRAAVAEVIDAARRRGSR